MRRLISIFTALILAVALCGAPAQAEYPDGYYRLGLTGGTATDLDSVDGAQLTGNEIALTVSSGVVYWHILDATSGLAESPPGVISPDTNAGTKRWELLEQYNVISGVHPPSGVGIIGGVAGLILSNNTTDSDHDIDISAGACFDSTGVHHITMSTAITKSLDSAWAADNGDATPEGMLLNGSIAAGTLYNVYELRNDTDGTGDFGAVASGDAIATYKPAGYTYYRWIGYLLTDGAGNIRQFEHKTGDIITFAGGFEMLTAVNTASLVEQDISGSIPVGRTEYVTIGGNANAAAAWIAVGTESGGPFAWLDTSGATSWSDIAGLHASGSTIIDIQPTSAGSIFVYTQSTATDIWAKAVKIIR